MTYQDGPNVRFLVALIRRFPNWAVWLPSQGHWTAVRAQPGIGAGLICPAVVCRDREGGRPGGANGGALVSTEQVEVATTDWPLVSSLVLGALPSAVPCARLHARHVLWEWGTDTLVEPVEMIVSELVTNGVRASAEVTGSWYRGRWAPGKPPVRLFVCSDQRSVLVQVWDGNDQQPERRELDLEAVGGRGLLLIEALSSDWGTYRPERSSGKIVWAVVNP